MSVQQETYVQLFPPSCARLVREAQRGLRVGAWQPLMYRLTPRDLVCALHSASVSLLLLAGCSGGSSNTIEGIDLAELLVSPASDFLVTGVAGDLAIPSSKVYSLTNSGSTAAAWTISSNAPWLTADMTGVVLAPSESIDLNVSIIQSEAILLSNGFYSAEIGIQDSLGQGPSIHADYTVSGLPINQPRTMSAATRTSGVAPLLVIFDALDTVSPAWTSGVVQPQNEDIGAFQYNWDFGDVTCGRWPVSSRSRNEDTGVVAAHVFEDPGTFPVILRVTTPDDQVHIYIQEITVLPFSGTTYYVSSSAGNDANAGTSPTSPLRSFDVGIAWADSNVRVLFRRGDTFTTAGFRRITAPGPGIIGAYHVGADPIVSISSGSNGGGLLSIENDDWRVQDIDFVGAGRGIDQSGSITFSIGSPVRDFLALRVDSREFRVGMIWDRLVDLSTHNVIGIVGCEIYDCEHNGAFIGARHLAVLGNSVHDMERSHLIRVWQANKSVIGHNLLANPGPTRQNLKLNSPDHSIGTLATEFVQICDNEIVGNGLWSVAIAPENTTTDQRVRGVVFERNRCAASDTDLTIRAREVIIRNNVFDGSNPPNGYTAIQLLSGAATLNSDSIAVYNNTVYVGGDSDDVTLMRGDAAATNVAVESNVVSATNSILPIVLVAITPAVGINNLILPPTDFVNPGGGDFRLNPGSAAVDSAIVSTRVREDFDRTKRTLLPDCGAFEQ
jgi:hypothetical protein